VDLGLIALIFTAALLGPALSLLARGAVPVVVGQLLAGLILGKTGLQLVNPDKSELALLYSLGFATLMFTVGIQVPLHDRRLRSALRSGMIALLVAVPLSLAAGLVAHLAGGGPTLVYAVVIVSSSAAVALPVIEESGLSGAAVLAGMAWITIADILATVAIPLAITPKHAAHAALGALIVAALVAAVFILAARLRHVALVQRIREEGKRRTWAIDLRLAVIVLVSLSFVAQKVGASLLVAGFGTGLVVGAKLDMRALGSSHRAVILACALAAFAIAVHVLASIVIRAPKAIGLLASAQMGVPAAVIALGLPAHAIDQAQASAIFCAALVSIGSATAGVALLRRGEDAAAHADASPRGTVPVANQRPARAR